MFSPKIMHFVGKSTDYVEFYDVHRLNHFLLFHRFRKAINFYDEISLSVIPVIIIPEQDNNLTA